MKGYKPTSHGIGYDIANLYNQEKTMSAKGEMYKSKGAMKKHEKGEGMKERMMEYGKKAAPSKKAPVRKAKAKKK